MDPAMADPFQQPSPISMGSATSTARRGKMIVGEMSEIFILWKIVWNDKIVDKIDRTTKLIFGTIVQLRVAEGEKNSLIASQTYRNNEKF